MLRTPGRNRLRTTPTATSPALSSHFPDQRGLQSKPDEAKEAERRCVVCVCGTPVCQGFNDSFVYLYAGGAGSSDTARANEALCQMDRETYLQVSSWVLEAQLDWP